MTPAEKLQKADKIIKEATNQAKEAISFWVTLEYGNKRKRLIKSLNNTRGAHCWNLIARALVNETILALMRLLDKAGQHRQSLQNLVAMTNARDMHKLICRRALEVCIASNYEHKRRIEHAAKRRVRSAAGRLEQLLASREYHSLRRHRDNHLAHVLDQDPAPYPAKYGYVNKVVRRTCRIIQCYRVALLADLWTPNADEDAWNSFSRDFYSRLEKGSLAINRAAKKENARIFPRARRKQN